MPTETEKLKERFHNEKNPQEKQHLRKELDQVPLSSGELEQVQQREADRKAADVKKYRDKHS